AHLGRVVTLAEALFVLVNQQKVLHRPLLLEYSKPQNRCRSTIHRHPSRRRSKPSRSTSGHHKKVSALAVALELKLNISLPDASNLPQLANARKLQQVRDPKVPVRLGQFGPPIWGIQERRWILAEELEDDLGYNSPAYLPQIFTLM